MDILAANERGYLPESTPDITSVSVLCSAKTILSTLVLFAVLLSMGLSAQTISPEMLKQLQSLPRAQQEVMAKQYGVNLDAILNGEGGQAGAKSNIAMPGEPLNQKAPVSDEDAAAQETWRLFQEKYAEFQQDWLEDKDKTKRYGVSLFDREVSTFAPTDDASVPDNYRLGAGDHLVVQLFGKDSGTHDLQLSREGKISFPKLGPITLAGLTFEDARDLVQSRVAEQLIGVRAAISMGRLRAINVFMAGEVAIPGAYSVSALTTITQALFQSGGISEIGSLRNIQVKRDGREIASFDVYQLLMKGDASADLRLQSGDVVFVPPYAGLVAIEGAVNRPMIYEYIEGESISDAIFMAGGLNQDAYESAISVVSKAIGKTLPEVKNVDLALSEEKQIKLRNGDLITVPKSTDNLKNAVTIVGAVVRPGIYGWVPGQRVSDLLASLEGDLRTYADIDYALVVRQKNQLLDIQVLSVGLGKAITNKASVDDIFTAPRDKIIVFAKPRVGKRHSGKFEDELVLNDTNFEYSMRGKNKSSEYSASAQNKNSEYSKHPQDRSSQPSQNNDLRPVMGAQNLASDRGMGAHNNNPSRSKSEKKKDLLTVKLEEAIDAAQREILLAPIIQKLIEQSRSGEPLQVVSVSGAVKSPGIFPLGTNDTVVNLLVAAGGLRDDAYLGASELRNLYAGKNSEVLTRYSEIDLDLEIRSAAGTLLRSRDHLNVRMLPDWNPDDSVTVLGEVRFPGEYRIRKGEAMSSVVARAGGLLPTAFARGTVFTRESIAEQENIRAKEFANTIVRDFASSQLTKEDNNVSIDEIEAVAEILENFSGIGRLLVNVDAALSGDEIADLILEDGDELVIPPQNSTVTVVGEIRRPGTHSYQAGLDLIDYLSLSAGASARADEDELYVVRADGSVFRPVKSWILFAGSHASVAPGDTIVVPIDAGYTDRLSMWRDVTQVVFNSTAGLATILAATK